MDWEEEWARGWRDSDENICPECIGDTYLKDIVSNALIDEESCSFCGADGAAAFNTFMEALMVGVNNSFEQVDNAGMPWEGGYVFEDQVYDAYEIADEFSWVVGGTHEDQVFEELRDCLDPDKRYASRWWIELEPEKAYTGAWEEFRQQIKHKTRFVFWAAEKQGDSREGAGEISVARILGAIGSLLEEFNLILSLPAETIIYRARGHENPSESQQWRAADLGTNIPENSVGSSRMSPPGIPLFYGADEISTALVEARYADKRSFFTVGKFTTTEQIEVVNLVDIPDIPSIFDPELGTRYGEISFLHDLVKELRQPVENSRASLDYIPTQVFCEYFLHIFREGKIRGLTWNSAASPDHGRCFAFNIPHVDCVDSKGSEVGRPQLILVEDGKTTYRWMADGFRIL